MNVHHVQNNQRAQHGQDSTINISSNNPSKSPRFPKLKVQNNKGIPIKASQTSTASQKVGIQTRKEKTPQRKVKTACSQKENQHKTKKMTKKIIPVKASWEPQRKGIEIERHRERNLIL